MDVQIDTTGTYYIKLLNGESTGQYKYYWLRSIPLSQPGSQSITIRSEEEVWVTYKPIRSGIFFIKIDDMYSDNGDQITISIEGVEPWQPPSVTTSPEPDPVPDVVDSDKDGLSDKQETEGIRIGYDGQFVRTVKTDPSRDDTDGDGIIDGVEILELKYYNVSGDFYEAIDDPTASKYGTLVDGIEFSIEGLFEFDSNNVDQYRRELLKAEEYRERLHDYHMYVEGFVDQLSDLGNDQIRDYLFEIEQAGLAFYYISKICSEEIYRNGTYEDAMWLWEHHYEYWLYDIEDPTGSSTGETSTYSTSSSSGNTWLRDFGIAVHKSVGKKFLEDIRIKPYGIADQPIDGFRIRPDMLYDNYDLNYAEIFELKPISNSIYFNEQYYRTAQHQLEGYVSAFKYNNPDYTVSKGTIERWNVIYHLVPVSETIGGKIINSTVVLYQFPDQPGMVYYKQFREDRKYIDKYVVPMNGTKYTTTVNGNHIEVKAIAKDTKTGKVAAIGMIGGAVHNILSGAFYKWRYQ